MNEENLSVVQANALFDDYADSYEEACQQGLALSGESRDYFASERIAYTAGWLASIDTEEVRRVTDFGCGLGHSTPHLQEYFPSAHVFGLDISPASIARARELYGSDRATFSVLSSQEQVADADLVYCNGVFHHIARHDRAAWASMLRGLLRAEGHLALWENNPWNPGTKWVMRRIPFDRDAIPLSPPETRRLLVAAGFELLGTRFRFCFPRFLAWFRGLERFADRLPLGAQYCTLARKPSVEADK